MRRFARFLTACLVAVASSPAAAGSAGEPFWTPAIEARHRGFCADAPARYERVPIDGYGLLCRHLAANRTWFRARFLEGSYARLADRVRESAGPVARVLYPFGGPDLITPFAVYPDAGEVLAIGLESVGRPDAFLADAHELERLFPPRAGAEGLPGTSGLLLDALLPFYAVGYFTVEQPFPKVSVAHLVLHQALHDLGARELAVRPLDVSAAGELVAGDGEAPRGLELAFLDAAGVARVHRYLTADLSDDHLETDPGVVALLDRFAADGALIKAGSNLIVRDDFSVVRGALERHARVVTDDGEIDEGDGSGFAAFERHAVALDGLGIGYASNREHNEGVVRVRRVAPEERP